MSAVFSGWKKANIRRRTILCAATEPCMYLFIFMYLLTVIFIVLQVMSVL